MEELAFDVLEEMLIRLDVKDVIRCKSVCKSWLSFISTPRFVKAHLNHNIKSDRDNRQLRNRRIHTDNNILEDAGGWNYIHIVGSCNGLVCASPRYAEFLVTNPSTRQQKILPDMFETSDLICWGFGYDSSSDDYKVIVGFNKDLNTKWTTFHVLTLKSNTWKVIGGVECYNTNRKTGVLCGGALYWFMWSNNKKVIISLDLSTEELKEIPQPDDTDHNTMTAFFEGHKELGVIEGCLCIYWYPSMSAKKWVKRNNEWELYIDDDCRSKHDVAHCLNRVNDSRKPKGHAYILKHHDGLQLPCRRDYLRASVFVKSLVSPHPQVDNAYDLSKTKQGVHEDNEGVESGNIIQRKRNNCKWFRNMFYLVQY